MFIKTNSNKVAKAAKTARAYSLVEMMVALGLFSISSMALASIFIFCTRSYAAMSNYAILDQNNRQTMNQVTSEIRAATAFVNYSSNSNTRTLSITNSDGNLVDYTFNSASQQLTRSCNGINTVLLDNCNLLNFNLGMRPPPPPTNSVFDVYYPPDMTQTGWQQTVKVIQLTWKTAIDLSPTANINSEDVQTAYIVIRK